MHCDVTSISPTVLLSRQGRDISWSLWERQTRHCSMACASERVERDKTLPTVSLLNARRNEYHPCTEKSRARMITQGASVGPDSVCFGIFP
jgi:hypothetical protein